MGYPLIKRNDIDANSKSQEGMTPLTYAAMHYQFDAVEHLLRQKNIEADIRDNMGRSPVSYADEYSFMGVVELLCQ